MRKAKIFFKDEEAGILTQFDDASFIFKYTDSWLLNSNKPSISLTLPKIQKEFRSKYLFPFFYNMLPEGSNKQLICNFFRIDNEDHFGLLLTTAKNDSIGAVKVFEITDKN